MTGSEERPPLLEVADLVVEYATAGGPVRASDGVSLAIGAPGEVLGVIGESGSGKSSLANAIMRVLPRNARIAGGRVRLLGRDVTALSDDVFRREVRWKGIAMVFQGAMTALNPVIRVGDQATERLRQDGLSKRDADARLADLLDRVGLPRGTGRRYPHELSGGMKQRVMIAMALTHDPQLLILDEPTSALDVSIQAQIMNLLKELRRERGIAMLFITHDLALASDLCDRIAVVYAGQLRELGSAEAVIADPRDPYTGRLMATIPRLHGDEAPGFVPGTPPDLRQPPAGCRFRARCPVAFERCAEPPPLVEVDAGHVARCWLAMGRDGSTRQAGTEPGAARTSIVPSGRSSDQDDGSVSATHPALRSDGLARQSGTDDAMTRRNGVTDSPVSPVRRLDPTTTTVAATAAGHGDPAPDERRATSALLALEGVSVDFHVRQGFFAQAAVRAVRDVSLTLERGEHLAVVGESGSGKTTLGRAALALLPVSTGRVCFDGVDIATLRGDDLRAFRRRAQIVFQDPYASLSPYLRVLDLVAEPLDIHGGVPRTEREARVVAALEAVRLTPMAEITMRFPHTLSGGQRQRVAIARAMILSPDLLVADEPVSMIDASSRAEILALLRDLQRTRALTLLSITHDLASARHSADRIAVMYAGRVVEVGGSTDLVTDPRHPYTRALLAAVPEPDPANRHRMRPVVGGEPPNPAALPSGCAFRTRCPVAIAGVCDVVDPSLVARAGGGLVACHREPAAD